MIPGLSTAKLIGLGIGLIAVLGFIAIALSWRSERNELRDWQATTVSATRDASGNPKLHKRDVPQQIRAIGNSLAAVTRSLERQNAAVEALAKRTEEQQREAAEAAQDARTRARAPERLSDSLNASSRAAERAAKPCEPSETLKEAWR